MKKEGCIFQGSYCKDLDLYDCVISPLFSKSPLEVGCGFDDDKIHKCSKLHRLNRWLEEVLNK